MHGVIDFYEDLCECQAKVESGLDGVGISELIGFSGKRNATTPRSAPRECVRRSQSGFVQVGLAEVIFVVPAKSHFDQVHVASTASKPNLAKSPYFGSFMKNRQQNMEDGRLTSRPSLERLTCHVPHRPTSDDQ
jgi:hypothetical protein